MRQATWRTRGDGTCGTCKESQVGVKQAGKRERSNAIGLPAWPRYAPVGAVQTPSKIKEVPGRHPRQSPAPLPHRQVGGEDENRCDVTAGDGR
jgi:hypothetical protein